MQIGTYPVKYILVVGGFGESPYLRKRLQNTPNFRGIPVTVPDQSGAKAASEGAVLCYVNRNVVARATRFAFGSPIFIQCTVEDALPLGRPWVSSVGGKAGVNGGWSEIVKKVRPTAILYLKLSLCLSHLFPACRATSPGMMKRFTNDIYGILHLPIFPARLSRMKYTCMIRETPTTNLPRHGSWIPTVVFYQASS
jgi:hypothetical protein